MICPEFRALWQGVDAADSIMVNPHEWLGAPFDCSGQFVRKPAELVKTLTIQPKYLKTHGQSGIVNTSEWSVPLGRWFRALKLWFLLRFHGLVALRAMIRIHVVWARQLAERVAHRGFEVATPPIPSLFSFCLKGGDDAAILALVQAINDDGRIYLTQTRVAGQLAIRFVAGAFAMTKADADIACRMIVELAEAAH